MLCTGFPSPINVASFRGSDRLADCNVCQREGDEQVTVPCCASSSVPTTDNLDCSVKCVRQLYQPQGSVDMLATHVHTCPVLMSHSTQSPTSLSHSSVCHDDLQPSETSRHSTHPHRTKVKQEIQKFLSCSRAGDGGSGDEYHAGQTEAGAMKITQGRGQR